jgi:hypothetical protein
MVARKENLQSLRVGAEQEPDFQSSAAFKYILPYPPDGYSRVKVRPAEAVGQDSQSLFHTAHIRVAQILERGQKARTEQNGGFSHVSIFQ